MAERVLFAQALAEGLVALETWDKQSIFTRVCDIGLGATLATSFTRSVLRAKGLKTKEKSKIIDWIVHWLSGVPLEELFIVRKWYWGEPLQNTIQWGAPVFSRSTDLLEWFQQSGLPWVSLEQLMGWAYPYRARDNSEKKADPYERTWVKKKRGGYRLIEAPRSGLKAVQKKLLHGVIDNIPMSECVMAYCRGRSNRMHASRHCGQYVVIRFDLEDFFTSITEARVRGLFEMMGYQHDVAEILAALCTTKTPTWCLQQNPSLVNFGEQSDKWFRQKQKLRVAHLAQGAPTSALLANAILHTLDRRMSGVANAFGAQYSRYADDLVFSGDYRLLRVANRLSSWVTAIAKGEGFSINKEKTLVMRKGQRQMVTGVVVNEKLSIDRRQFDLLKAILTNCIRFGWVSQNKDNRANFLAHLRGRVGYMTQIDKNKGAKLQALFDRIVK